MFIQENDSETDLSQQAATLMRMDLKSALEEGNEPEPSSDSADLSKLKAYFRENSNEKMQRQMDDLWRNSAEPEEKEEV
jgi:hypothetical protein